MGVKMKDEVEFIEPEKEYLIRRLFDIFFQLLASFFIIGIFLFLYRLGDSSFTSYLYIFAIIGGIFGIILGIIRFFIIPQIQILNIKGKQALKYGKYTIIEPTIIKISNNRFDFFYGEKRIKLHFIGKETADHMYKFRIEHHNSMSRYTF